MIQRWVLMAGLGLSAGFSAQGAITNYVWQNSPSPGSPYATWDTAAHDIQSAVNAAVAGNTVLVGSQGNQPYLLTGAIQIDKDILVRGEVLTGDRVIVDGQNLTRCFFVDGAAAPEAAIEHLTIRNGTDASGGGGVYLNGGGRVGYCAFESNSCPNSYGGAVACNTGGEVEYCDFIGNSAWNGGAAAFLYEGGMLSSGVLSNNQASADGGALYFYQGGAALAVQLLNNTAAGNGGGACLFEGGSLIGATVGQNISSNMTGGGGGVYLDGGGVLMLSDLHENQAWSDGGGVLATSNSLLSDLDIRHNDAGLSGGGAWCGPGVALDSSDVYLNQAFEKGGGVFFSHGGEMSDCTVSSNGFNSFLVGQGGGLFLDGGGLCSDSRFFYNNGVWGGGIYFNDGGAVSNALILENSARSGGMTITPREGGGAYIREAGLLAACQILGNEAGQGAGVFCTNGGMLVNCLIQGNAAAGHPDSSDGGGLYLAEDGTANHCTIAGNSAEGWGGGLRMENGGSVFNSIVYFNTAATGSNVLAAGSGFLMDYCCSAPASGAGTHNTGLNPQFVNYATGNLHLSQVSPCIDSGDDRPSILADLEGNPRPLNGNENSTTNWDMGAYEFAGGNTDMDPQADWQEIVAGTDPYDPADYFRATTGEWDVDLGYVLVWPSAWGREYKVDSSTNLPGGIWREVERLSGTGGLLQFSTNDPVSPQFFRLRVSRTNP